MFTSKTYLSRLPVPSPTGLMLRANSMALIKAAGVWDKNFFFFATSKKKKKPFLDRIGCTSSFCVKCSGGWGDM